uniref:Peptidoglycan recognition protein 5 n=1 Tax=Oncorhynchus tshawytscha TaxID=74940 RepID=A0A8C8CGE7_ONCTS
MKRRSDVCIHSLCCCPTVHYVSLGFTVAENRKTGGCVGLKYSTKSETFTGILTLCVRSSSSCWSVRTGTAKICMDHLNAISYHVVEEHLLGHHFSCHTPHGTALWGHQLIHIQRMHMQDRNFDDIGYNFLIGGDCTVYEGRGWGVVGTHTKGNNHNSLAIAFMGNFNNESPSPAAKSSVKQLLQCGVSQGHFHPVFILLGHRDLRDTECPGERLYAALKHLKFP